jgi:hypothetical protein
LNTSGALLATTAERLVRIWTRTGELVAELPPAAVGVGAMCWEPGRDVLAVAGFTAAVAALLIAAGAFGGRPARSPT